MKKVNIADRLEFLAKTFDVFDGDSDETFELKIKEVKELGYEIVKDRGFSRLAILGEKKNNKDRVLKKVSVEAQVFSKMIVADPTENKIYLQWMLTLFTNLIKDGNDEGAIRLVIEDLPQAKEYLILFNDNKRKKKFTDLCNGSYILKGIEDPTNINQYKSLAQLFDAVDPFIVKEPSEVEGMLKRYVDSGQAVIPVSDRKFTLYIPKTTGASVIFNKFANWCTAKEGNGMFNSYRENNKKPNGKNSDIYIIINNKFFSGESDEIYQLHFETKQIKDKRNGSNVSIFEDVISQSEGLSNFFYEELMGMAKDFRYGLEGNIYLDFLVKFGFTDSLFEILESETPIIKFVKREIPKIPDLSRFKELIQLVIVDGSLSELPPSIGKLTNLDMLVLTNNKLKSLPSEIGSLKNLTFMNLNGNPIKDIPTDIKYLDKSNGGSLFRLGVNEVEVGPENYRKLRELLPTTIM